MAQLDSPVPSNQHCLSPTLSRHLLLPKAVCLFPLDPGLPGRKHRGCLILAIAPFVQLCKKQLCKKVPYHHDRDYHHPGRHASSCQLALLPCHPRPHSPTDTTLGFPGACPPLAPPWSYRTYFVLYCTTSALPSLVAMLPESSTGFNPLGKTGMSSSDEDSLLACSAALDQAKLMRPAPTALSSVPSSMHSQVTVRSSTD